jgi:two-component system, OmpR family, sensor kinase
VAGPQRLYLRLYLAFLGVLLAVFAASIALSLVLGRGVIGMFRQGPRVATHVARTLPPLSDPAGVQRAVQDLHDELGFDVAVLDLDGRPLADAGAPLPLDEHSVAQALHGPGWISRFDVVGAPVRRAGHTSGVLLLRVPSEAGRALARLSIWLTAVLLASLAAVYPLSRSITRRLERLTSAAAAFGIGDLAARSGISGDDEVGRLAQSFDQMAARIEAARKAEKELLANVSHELRTPIARLRVALELVAPSDEATARRIASLSEDLDELERLVADVLTASRLDLAQAPLRRARIRAVDLVEKGKQHVHALEPDREVDVKVEDGVAVDADEGLLLRALDNLLDNARKYGGKQPIRVEARRDGSDVVFAVADRGEGFAADELDRIFDPFYRGSASRGRSSGFGLGLALARRVVEAHGGRIRATNEPGGGARIEMRLPASA